MDYFEFRIKFTEKNKDEIESLLYLNGVENILDEGNEFITYIEEPLKWKVDELRNNLTGTGLISETDVSVKAFTGKDWNEEWKKTIEPVNISGRIVVYPSWKFDDVKGLSDKILIQIDPKMSFGTGHNETTQLMLEMMVKHLNGNESVMLDYGCGTAVLAIAGVKLGVKKAIAIDNDPDVIENATEYVSLNNEIGKVEIKLTDLKGCEESGFDVICANIIRSVIEETFDLIDAKLNSGGKLFLSGILKEEWDKVVKHLMSFNYSPIEINSKAEWLGIYAVKP